jgi:hypothetical protein
MGVYACRRWFERVVVYSALVGRLSDHPIVVSYPIVLMTSGIGFASVYLRGFSHPASSARRDLQI